MGVGRAPSLTAAVILLLLSHISSGLQTVPSIRRNTYYAHRHSRTLHAWTTGTTDTGKPCVTRPRTEPLITESRYKGAQALSSAFLVGGVLTGAACPAVAANFAALATTSSDSIAGVVGPGFVQAFSLIFVSEIGDKTFFIAALLAAKFNRLVSFVGSVGALTVMTFISVALGQIFNAVPSGLSNGLPLDDIAAAIAFAYFGFRTLTEALQLEDDVKGGELLDAEEALEEVDAANAENFWNLVAQTFGLVFAAEFGDRSFLSTIALSAAQNPSSVAAGAIAAHAIATTGAVAGGVLISKYISEKVIGIIGGSLFLVFAVTTAFGFF